jgi:hypothetical protein
LYSPRQPETNLYNDEERKWIMNNSVKFGSVVTSLCAVIILAGCSSTYYKVTDPQSGNAYYTENIDKVVGTGAVKVKDARTGSLVTLQSSEVKEISEKEYKAGIAAPVTPPAPATPAVVAAPALVAVPEAASAVAPAPAADPSSAAGGMK